MLDTVGSALVTGFTVLFSFLSMMEFALTDLHRVDEEGFCSNDASASKFGVKVSEVVSIELWLELKLKLGNKENLKKLNPFSRKIFGMGFPLDEACFELSGNGIGNFSNKGPGTVPTLDPAELLPIPTNL